ncbi:MAG: transcriptional regulator [Acidobacteriales bacterium]|nr:transcriptional regulator [Terriglobales bacterium]
METSIANISATNIQPDWGIDIRSGSVFERIVGESPALLKVLEMVEMVAESDSTVLLLGETGTGKELVARAIHDRSGRNKQAFVKLNCAAIPSGLLESELFGHERGAFTGAVIQRIGRFELASEGTAFLDEIGELPLELQPKLLRVLQEREFERLGSARTQRTNARLIAATNRNLEKMIGSDEFRSDLYYRLSVFPIYVPALRERPEDIPLLVRYFTEKYARRMNKQIDIIPADTIRSLTRRPWPGNIRELENVIERAVILTRGNTLQVAMEHSGPTIPTVPSRERGANIEREEILRVLRATKGRVDGPGGAAARMAVKRTTLISRMKKLGIVSRREIEVV